MPFKNLHSPKSVLKLDGEVTGAAVLAGAGTVAFVANDPQELAVVSGSGARRHKLGLTRADGVALLSREIAVVQAGDEVWALLGLLHTPKTEQVERDARSLSMRPSGDSALVLGWDGGGTQLTVTGHEVTARKLALRGQVEAMAQSSQDTAVLVGEGASRELRVHPGATPEPGARQRFRVGGDLAPTHLKLGERLALAYARGASSIALARLDGPGGEARSVELAGGVVDADVAETSVFALHEDGSLALYDRAALTTTGGAAEPTFRMSLPARGEPTVLVVAGKVTPTLWIGTRAGEIVSAAVARKPS